MNRTEALQHLAAAGLVGADAETALAHALKRARTADVSELIARVQGYSSEALMEFYGSDAGRVAVVFSDLELEVG